MKFWGGKVLVRKAHQSIMREKYAAEEADLDLFGAWWEKVNTTLSKSIVKPISIERAKPIILKYEYLGTMPGWSEYAFGQYFNNYLGGVLVFGHTTGSDIAFSKMFPKSKVITLQRGVNLHWTPKNSASYFIARACRWLRENTDYHIVTATADEEAGEIGTIYQALNWIYVGRLTHGHPVFVIDGKEIHPKTLYDRHGTSSVSVIEFIYGDRLEVRERKFKHRYVHPLYKDFIIQGKPYPKRKKSGNKNVETKCQQNEDSEKNLELF